VGSAEAAYAKLAIRCAVTLVAQESGTRAGPEPLRTLAGYRRAAEGGVAFGTKLVVLRPGRVSVGDEVIVTAWGESELRPPRRLVAPRQLGTAQVTGGTGEM
ncbi:MAG: MOSC domain-containing protein, partial [Actinomycetia bacterium]|nr:MOSC domain-containing protein [Actinomycetes bacterium]